MEIREKLYKVKHALLQPYKKIKRKYFSISSPQTYIMSDKSFIKKEYKLRTGNKINLNNPQTLTEKLVWLKLYDREPRYTIMSDKWAVRKYLIDKLGRDYSVPLIGTYWENANDIDFSSLPEKCVLKCNHVSDVVLYNSGKGRSKSGVAFNSDKEIAEYLNKQLESNYYYKSREWPYKNIKSKIICETFLENSDGSDLVDYKFYCYGGKVRYFMYSVGEIDYRLTNHKFDTNCNSIDYLFKDTPNLPLECVHLPENIQDMIDIANQLCEGIQHIRVDMYNIDGRIYLGELTFFSRGGYINIKDDAFAQSMAAYIDLSKVKKKR